MFEFKHNFSQKPDFTITKAMHLVRVLKSVDRDTHEKTNKPPSEIVSNSWLFTSKDLVLIGSQTHLLELVHVTDVVVSAAPFCKF